MGKHVRSRQGSRGSDGLATEQQQQGLGAWKKQNFRPHSKPTELESISLTKSPSDWHTLILENKWLNRADNNNREGQKFF